MRDFLRFAFAPACLLLLGACGLSGNEPASESTGTTAGAVANPAYEAALSRWVDHPEEDLVAAWGVPERSQRLTDGGQALEYRSVRDGQLLCTTLFTSDVYGMIRTWAYRGTDCRVPRLGDYSHSS
jgi:hypothetical protein